MSTKAERRITGDSYPGQSHPAVKHHRCPTCHSLRGQPCVVMTPRAGPFAPHRFANTRTHRTRLNVWRIAQQQRRKRARAR